MENQSKVGDSSVRRIVSKYELGQQLGAGAYSQVYQATHTEEGGTFAVKVIANRALAQNAKVKEGISNELTVHNVMEAHPNIVRFHELLQTKNNCYFVYEYCAGGTLNDLLKKEGILEEERAIEIFMQLVEGLKVLRRHNIMHRDLKPENVLISGERFKLGDFAFCKELESSGMTRTMLGSPLYMAPEVLKGEAYTNTADMWSVGVMLYEMLHGYCPFQSSSIAALINTIDECQPKFDSPKPLSPHLRSFIAHCLQKDPHKRLTWEKFFTEADQLGRTTLRGSVQSVANSRSQIHFSEKEIQLKSYNSTCLEKEKPERGFKHTQSKSKYELFKENYNRSELNGRDASGKKENPFKKGEDRTLNFVGRHSDLLPKDKNKTPKLTYNQMIREHGRCLESLKGMMEVVRQRDCRLLGGVMTGLVEVKQGLEKIYNSINLEDSQMLGLLSIVKYELIQVEKVNGEVDEMAKADKAGARCQISDAREGLARLMARVQ